MYRQPNPTHPVPASTLRKEPPRKTLTPTLHRRTMLMKLLLLAVSLGTVPFTAAQTPSSSSVTPTVALTTTVTVTATPAASRMSKFRHVPWDKHLHVSHRFWRTGLQHPSRATRNASNSQCQCDDGFIGVNCNGMLRTCLIDSVHDHIAQSYTLIPLLSQSARTITHAAPAPPPTSVSTAMRNWSATPCPLSITGTLCSVPSPVR
ncbi:hypothetical protein BC938DRAFT_479350 [Jimgerdemannia flammicorona]|uniref:Uncharacterized protein n=1 Tax=Jimgerdemannia flammicorona TaxID=994334 RepID=A0A433QL18_9FUNG|nr:hypothetical protein BC938DRAFT_479350 [Jimgerdemannia flammicorona]